MKSRALGLAADAGASATANGADAPSAIGLAGDDTASVSRRARAETRLLPPPSMPERARRCTGSVESSLAPRQTLVLLVWVVESGLLAAGDSGGGRGSATAKESL